MTIFKRKFPRENTSLQIQNNGQQQQQQQQQQQ
jgi:hypothetical protein